MLGIILQVVLRKRNKLYHSANLMMESKASYCGHTGFARTITNKKELKSNNIVRAQSLSKEYSYENAINALNDLQSNASVLNESIIKQQPTKLEDTVRYIEQSGLSMNDLERLSIIHVSGTKGKGSTCAYAESILRSFGCKTGFFSSPHLVEVTERIRLNGKPISKDKFAKHFWKVYNRLRDKADRNRKLPAYFHFLTIMSFHVFLEENVDVLILEVGIGGEYDCTNVVRHTKVVGITSLGLEHTNILGNTLDEIAWHKAGIIKPNSNVYTTNQQVNGCLSVLRRRSSENNAKLHIAPGFNSYKWSRIPNIKNSVQRLNASLAIQLSYDWLRNNINKFENKLLESLDFGDQGEIFIPENVISALENCIWPGRFQIIKQPNKRLFIDGAHTFESLDVCIKWFKSNCNSSSKKYLIFNVTGDRNAQEMLRILNRSVSFDMAFFSPNVSVQNTPFSDSVNIRNPQSEQLGRCLGFAQYWNEMYYTQLPLRSHSKVFGCVSDIFQYMNSNHIKDAEVLVTGSLHLVGATLAAIGISES